MVLLSSPASYTLKADCRCVTPLQRAAAVATGMMGYHQLLPLLTQVRLPKTLMKKDQMSDHNRRTEQHPDVNTLRSQHLTCGLASDWTDTTLALLQEMVSVARCGTHH